MRRVALILWFCLPISGSSLMAQIAHFLPPTADSLSIFIEKKDARAVLIQANKVAHEQPERALVGFDTALHLATEQHNRSLVSSIFRDKGLFFEDLNRLDSALIFYEKSRLVVDSLGSVEGRLTIYNDLAIVSRKLEQYKSAKKFHLAALDLAEKSGDAEMVEFSFHGLGALYETVGDSTAALDWYLKSKIAAEQRGSVEGQIITLQNIARTYTGLRDEKNALANIRRALQLVENQRDTTSWADVALNFGDILKTFQKPSEAVEFYKKSAFFYEKMGEPASAIGARMKQAAIFSEEKQTTTALEIYNDCLGRKDVLAADQLAEIELSRGLLFQKMGRLAEAEAALKNGLAGCEKNQLAKASIKNLEALHSFFSATNRPELALFYLKKANFRQDSLSAAMAERGSGELEFRYDQEQNQRTMQELRLRENRFWLAGILLIGFCLAVFLAWVIRLRRRANEALKAKNLEIEDQNLRLTDSNRFLQQFTYAVAHDLKAPLRTVGSFITILEQRFGTQFPREAHEYMAFVTSGVRRMDSLIQDLLEYSRISSQRAGASLVEPKSVVEEACQRLSVEISARKATVEIGENLPVLPVERSHLLVLFQNLISNALKFNHSDEPTIKVGGQRENGRIRFFVEDNGIGIDPEHGQKIFELFHQLHKNKGFSGTGIGLTVCKNIVDKYEGKIWFEAVESGDGTRFWFELLS